MHARPDRGWITVSVWDGDQCRATFHLRQADAPHLVYELAAGLAGGRDEGADPVTGPRPSVPALRGPLATAANLLGRGSRWLHEKAAGVRPGQPASAPPQLRAVEDPGDDPDRSPG
jgi:hypothetical protein